MDDIILPHKSLKKTGDFVLQQLREDDEVKPLVTNVESEPTNKIKVRFDKFIQLVATHDFEQVISRFGNEEVVLNSDLLTELASAHDSTEDKGNKVPIVFVIGLVLGIVLTYLLVVL